MVHRPFTNAVSTSDYKTEKKEKMIMYGKLEKMKEETVMVYFKVTDNS
jgi:hypothetical protein